jgi:hypothetical protein
VPLLGQAFLAMWHDVEPGQEAEYRRWHTHEHMPERLGLPGFRRGRDGFGPGLSRQRYLTIYEGETLEVFRSGAYLARLNDPTPWSARMATRFRNFLRVACETVATVGAGAGGAMATVRGDFAAGTDPAGFRRSAARLAQDLLALGPVSGVHVGLARKEYSDARTTESDLRPQKPEPAFDAVVLVEGPGVSDLEPLAGPIGAALAGAGLAGTRLDVYGLSFFLGRDGV